MYDRTGNNLIVAILIGMILGVVVVALFGEAALPVKFLGDIFLNALKMVVIPLLFCSMIVGITKLGDVRKLGRTGIKTLLYFLATSSVAVAIGLILVNVFQPGDGFILSGAARPEIASYSFFDWLTAQIPSNIVAAAAETKVLPIIVFALFFGGVLTTIGSKGRPVVAFFEGLNEAIMKIVHIIMWFAPLGIFGLVAGQLAAHGGLSGFSSVLTSLFKYSLVVILGLLIHGVVVLPLILKFIGGKNPIEYLIGMGQALMTACATASSSATLPVTMDCVEEKNDIDKRSSSFVLPLGATVNMDGTALYEAVAAMFIAQAYGVDLSIFAQITIFATAVLASIGAAGIPEAGLVTMVLVLQAVGLPLEGIGLILAIDWFLDRCRTTVNVWGDSIGAAVIATTAEIGLVDRRPRKPARDDSRRPSRTERSDRRKDPRKDPRFKKKGHDAARGPRDRQAPRGRKTEKPAGKVTRRPTAPTEKKRDGRAGAGHSVKKDRADGFRMSDKQEAYTPSSISSPDKKDKVIERRSSKREETRPSPASAVEKPAEKKTDKAAKAKPGYGRRPSRGRSAKKAAEDSGKIKIPPKAEESEIGTDAPEYTVPKFPAHTLEELTAEMSELETTADTPSPADEDATVKEKPPIEADSPKSTPTPAEEDSDDAEKDRDDFSRLDRMFVEKADEPAPAEKVAEPEPVADDSPSKSVFSPTDSGDESKDQRTDNSGTVTADAEVTSEEAVSAIPETAEDALVPAKNDTPPDKPETPETESDTTEKSDGSPDEEEPMQWGRSKRKKIKR